jgi:hypothetical protein
LDLCPYDQNDKSALRWVVLRFIEAQPSREAALKAILRRARWGRGSAGQWLAIGSALLRAIPDMSDALICNCRVDDGVGYRPVPHEGLQGPGINAAPRKGIPGRVPQHVGMNRKRQPGGAERRRLMWQIRYHR